MRKTTKKSYKVTIAFVYKETLKLDAKFLLIASDFAVETERCSSVTSTYS